MLALATSAKAKERPLPAFSLLSRAGGGYSFLESNMSEHTSSELYKASCENCGSSDGLGVYDDGHTHCYVCQTTEQASPTAVQLPIQTKKKEFNKALLPSEAQALPHRRITETTCRKFGYGVTSINNQLHEIANLRNSSGAIVAQKIRSPDKDFSIRGESKSAELFGSHNWSNGRRLIITEGEIDAMSVSQVQDNKWPVVSLPNGASSARKALQTHWEYIDKFDDVVLMFDQDEPGRKAAEDCAEVLPAGKCRIAHLPLKDANDMLVAGRIKELIESIYQAKPYRPDGIKSASDCLDIVLQENEVSDTKYPYPSLNDITKGLRRSELVTVTAGSGMGKTTLVREIAHKLLSDNKRVGLIMLEESLKRTLLGLIGIQLNKNITVDRTEVDDADISSAFKSMFNDDSLQLYDHFGSTDVEVVTNRIRYMVQALEVEWVILDHISILVSGLATNDERKLIDMAMTTLRTIVQELDIGMIVVSHLRRPDGDRGHEDGAQVRLNQLRGSHSVAQLSDICLSLEINKDSGEDMRQLRVLKNRFTGEVGLACTLQYDRDKGRLQEISNF